MIKKLAIILIAVLILFMAYALVSSGNVSVTINGEEITGPLDAIVGIWGLILAGVVLFCVAILLAFVFAGVGLIVLGVFVLVGFILLAVASPFLLPLLIPLFLVWLFCLVFRKSKPQKT